MGVNSATAGRIPRLWRRWLALLLLTLCIGGYARFRATSEMTAGQPPIRRIALLAPFEGEHREIGYNALYAARLALADAGELRVELLPLEDNDPVVRTAAVARDPVVLAALVLGSGAQPEAQQALTDVPVLIVGEWADTCVSPTVRILSDEATASHVLASVDDPEASEGGLLLVTNAALRRRMALGLPMPVVYTVGRPPPDEFTTRYGAGDPFAPEPNLLATLTYDATRWLISAVQASSTRADVLDILIRTPYTGYHTLEVADCFTPSLPTHAYQFASDGTSTEIAPTLNATRR